MGARWLEVAPEHLDPFVALWSMCNSLATDRLPDRRVVVRFDFRDQRKKRARFWLLIERGRGEVCATFPGEEDLVITADPEKFVRWHMGHLSWADASSDDGIQIEGAPDLGAGVSELERAQPLRQHQTDGRDAGRPPIARRPIASTVDSNGGHTTGQRRPRLAPALVPGSRLAPVGFPFRQDRR
jgi:hypothetical protein